MNEEDAPRLGLITTQTCDLREEGRDKPKRPWFHVAPVYDGSWLDASQRRQVELGRFSYLVHLTGLEEGFWIGDLRIEFPIEKGWLVGRTVSRGFATEADCIDFADKLADNKKRLALAEAVEADLLSPLRTAIDGASDDERNAIGTAVEVLLAVSGDRISPDAVGVVVVFNGPPAAGVQDWFDQWWVEAAALSDSGPALMRPRVIDGQSTEMSPLEYRELIPLSRRDWYEEG